MGVAQVKPLIQNILDVAFVANSIEYNLIETFKRVGWSQVGNQKFLKPKFLEMLNCGYLSKSIKKNPKEGPHAVQKVPLNWGKPDAYRVNPGPTEVTNSSSQIVRRATSQGKICITL